MPAPARASRRRLLTVTLLAGALALGLGACGDDDDDVATDDTTATTSTTAGGSATPTSLTLTTEPGGAGRQFSAPLTGTAERPAPGDEDGGGTSSVTIDGTSGQVCYEINVRAIGAPTKAHIHQGGPDVAGPVFISFFEAEGGELDACVQTEPTKAQAVLDNPGGFYVNVHTADYPAGAVRGQLSA